ncbi:helix-turn-helix transcriptional regulator [Streptomyces sp. NBC_00162]|uniref:helix-turn-helix transcriptional regulator n=1 Tax=Streptomyces sp. NBC_00162 TaxID=2903629 RepID=UPI00214CCDD1|nr:helix-turn-helix transcriptional regulator [Streptomyces sp. NBC_00162]UUU38732.1 helix-turn-helix transcriptional regulator [Streptomyces sp. NBC_00162]
MPTPTRSRDQSPDQRPALDELIGLAGLLRAWRAAASAKMRRSKPLSQAEVAARAGMTERWYGELERGASPRLRRPKIDQLAEALLLNEDQRETLYLYTDGGSPPRSPKPPGYTDGLHPLQLLLDHQMPRPAYLSDAAWNIVGFNRAMAQWFPWVLEPGANLMRWALLHPDAREQYVGWEEHARIYLAMVRMALVKHDRMPELVSVLNEVLADEDCRRIWDSKPELVGHRDGHMFRLNISRFDHQDIEVVTQVLYPAAFPDLRFVAITWLGSREDPGAEAARRSPSAVEGSGGRVTPPRPAQGTPPRPYWALDSFEAARSLAGSSPVDLPALSAVAGRGTRLTADFSGRNVIWATSEAGGTVAFEDLSTQEALARIPIPTLSAGARREYQNLLRSTLAPDGPTAARQIDELLIPHRAAIDLLVDLGSQLSPAGAAAPSPGLSRSESGTGTERAQALAGRLGAWPR